MKDYDELLSSLETQKRNFEVSFIKAQGAIEVIQQLKEEQENEEVSEEKE